MNQFMSDIAMSNKFPGKLWRMVNTCTSGAIAWSQGGHTIVINQAKFQLEYLDPPNCVFKTSNIGSFIRQLNLYGFRKLNALRFTDTLESEDNESRGMHEFQNDYFIQGRPDLLSRLRRNVGIRRSRELAVKRRMDIFHAIPKKVADSRYLQYVETGEQIGQSYRTMCPQEEPLHVEGVLGSPQAQSASAAGSISAGNEGDLPEIPVFLQWDGQSYKYVILPDHNLQFGQHGNIHENMPTLQKMIRPQQQQMLQQQPQSVPQSIPQHVPQSHVLLPRYDVVSTSELERTIAGNNLHVVHNEDGTESQQYYLINVRATNQDEVEEPIDTQNKHSEYIDMYEMARSFTSSSHSTPSINGSPEVSDSLVNDIRMVDDDSQDIRPCGTMELLDSSPSVLNRDASLPSISSGFDIESPCMSQGASATEAGMFPYDMIDKSELDVYIRGHDDLLLSATDRDDLVLFPGVNMTGAGDGTMDGSILDYQDKDAGGMAIDKPVIVESIESQYRKRNFFI